MKYLIFTVLLAGSAFSTVPAKADDILTRCDHCSDPASLARNLAGSQSRFGVTVFIVDFGRDQAYRYFVIDENPSGPNDKPTDAITALNEAADFPEILAEVTSEESRGGNITRVIQIAIEQREQDHFEGLVWWENYLASRGIDTHFTLP